MPADRSCDGCRFRDEVIVELQQQIRALRHELDNERVGRLQDWRGRPGTHEAEHGELEHDSQGTDDQARRY